MESKKMESKKKLRKIVSILLVLAMILGLCACGGKTDDNQESDGDKSQEPDGGSQESSGGVTEITWWTSYAQSNMEYLNVMVEAFNESQSQYHATIINQGSNSQIRTQLASTKTSNLPSMITGQPVTTGYYASSSFIANIQDFIDADEEDWTSGTYENVLASYSDLDGNLVGWPMGVSTAGWYVNVDLLKQAGYSVDDLTSFEKVAEAATAVVSKGYANYGLSFNTTGIDLHDYLTIQGVDILDNDNGYSGDATKCLFMEGDTYTSLTKAMTIFANLYQNNVAYTYGSSINSELIPMFVQQNLAMMFATNSYANKIILYQPEFEWVFIPSVGVDDDAEYRGNVLSEGTGSYICNTGDETEMQGAYELIKFMASAENQAYWCTCTGYIPYTEEAATQEEYVTWMEANFPSVENVKNLLLDSSADLRSPYTEVANALLTACNLLCSNVAVDPTGDLDTYIQEAATVLDEAIEVLELRRQ